MSLTAKEINKNIRHDIADMLTSYGVEWTGLHDNVIDGPIHQHILPLVEALEKIANASIQSHTCPDHWMRDIARAALEYESSQRTH